MQHENQASHEYDLRSYYGDPSDNPDAVREAVGQDMLFQGDPGRTEIVDNMFAAVGAEANREDQAERGATLLASTQGLLSTAQVEGAAVNGIFTTSGADIKVSGEDANGVWEQYRSGSFNGKPVHFVERFIPVSDTDRSTASMQVLMVGAERVEAAIAMHRYGQQPAETSATTAEQTKATVEQDAGGLALHAAVEKPQQRMAEDLSAQETVALVAGEQLPVEDVQLFSKAVQAKLEKIAQSEVLSPDDENFVISTTSLYMDNMLAMLQRGAAIPDSYPKLGVYLDGLTSDARQLGVEQVEHGNVRQFGKDARVTGEVLEAIKNKLFTPKSTLTPESYARYATDLAQATAGYFDAMFDRNMQGHNASGLTHEAVVFNLQEMAEKYALHDRQVARKENRGY